MPHLLSFFGLFILAFIALKTIEGGGDWFDFLNGAARYERAKTDFDFKMVFFMIGALVLGVIGYAVFTAGGGIHQPLYQAENAHPVPIAQRKVAQRPAHSAHTAAHAAAHASAHAAQKTHASQVSAKN